MSKPYLISKILCITFSNLLPHPTSWFKELLFLIYFLGIVAH